jgi:hypothetical protein
MGGRGVVMTVGEYVELLDEAVVGMHFSSSCGESRKKKKGRNAHYVTHVV